MNVKQKVGIVGGLVALLGAGCDKELTTIEASCEIAPGVEARVVNNQVVGKNYPSLEIYSNKTSSVLLNTQVSYWSKPYEAIHCMDGQVISWGKDTYGNLIVDKNKPKN